METIVGPLIALLLSLKFTSMKTEEQGTNISYMEERIASIKAKVELIEKMHRQKEEELPKKLVAALTPITKAVSDLNQELGIK